MHFIKKIYYNGFTLIELLIVLAIMMTLFGVGFANYRGYSQRKQIDAIAESIASDLQLAQEYASSGTRPSGFNCEPPETFSGFVYSKVFGQPTYQLRARCSNDTYSNPVKAVTIPTGYFLGGVNEIQFLSLGKGVNPAGTINVSRVGQMRSIIVTSTGEIRWE